MKFFETAQCIHKKLAWPAPVTSPKRTSHASAVTVVDARQACVWGCSHGAIRSSQSSDCVRGRQVCHWHTGVDNLGALCCSEAQPSIWHAATLQHSQCGQCMQSAIANQCTILSQSCYVCTLSTRRSPPCPHRAEWILGQSPCSRASWLTACTVDVQASLFAAA
jgi:hypothetical protein